MLGAQSGARADLIVADLRLADGASGIDAIGDIRAAQGSAVPALIVSGDTSETAREEACAAGITLLSKPVVASALRMAAERALERERIPPSRARLARARRGTCRRVNAPDIAKKPPGVTARADHRLADPRAARRCGRRADADDVCGRS